MQLTNLAPELHQQIAKYLPLDALENFCLTTKSLLWIQEDENFITYWLEFNLPEHLADYIEVAEERQIKPLKLIKNLISREESIFSYGVERLCRLAGRDNSTNSYKYYIRTLGWTFNAFRNFIDGLIDQNYNQPNSNKAKEILNYILYEDNIIKFVDINLKCTLNGNEISTVTDLIFSIKREITLKIKLHEFVIEVNKLAGKDEELPIFQESEGCIAYGHFNFLKYLANFDLILTLDQVKHVFRVSNIGEPRIDLYHFEGLLQSGKLAYTSSYECKDDLLKHYLSNNLIECFEIYLNSYYKGDEEIINYYLEYIFENKPRDLDKLTSFSNIDVLRKTLDDYTKSRPTGGFELHVLPVVTLRKERPKRVDLNFYQFLRVYLSRMNAILDLNLKPNPLVMFKLFELNEYLKPQLIKEILNPLVPDPFYNDVYYPVTGLPKLPLTELLKVFKLI